MVLSDGTIRKEIDDGRIVLDPYDPGLIQPSSVDVRVDRQFRVFQNDRTPTSTSASAMEDLTELVEIADGEPFILHPGEFVLGPDAREGRAAATTSSRASRARARSAASAC